MKIGPSFAEELKAAGVVDFRFTWGAEGKGLEDLLQFHPEVPAAERRKVEAVLVAHDGPLSEARHEALEATNAEAARRIAEMFRKPPNSFPLAWKEINALARAVEILDKKIEGTALPEERLDLEVLRDIYGRVEAIRETENKATAVLLGAKSVDEVEKVKPEWP
jgi:hypothetical protein